MNRTKILEVLTAEGHGAHAAALDALIQPAIWIRAEKLADRPPNPTAEAEEEEDEARRGAPAAAAHRPPSLEAALASLPLGASRFGGVPDLPPGVEWPSRDDVPMEFVAQLRLADAAKLDPLGRLPVTGHLWFFYNSQWLTFDQDQDHRCCAVLYHDVADDQLVRQIPPRVDYQGEYDSEPRLAPYVHGLATLGFHAGDTVPGGVSPWITGTPLEEFWQDFTAYHGSKIAIEGDVNYQSNRLLGYVDGQDYVEAHLHGTEDQLLLQVDSEDAADFQWGDCDRLYFFVSKGELTARDFSKARLYSLLG
ncbi:MAG: DUF1963 domain-containing protein [Myxococcales bacterium]|nr:DUF1963 domain-containing protein [Myxococcales bacterium]